jgi:hypothetical protein
MAATNKSKQLRAAKMKAANEVHPPKSEPWKRGSSLDTPPAKAGFDLRWVRFMVGGVYDATNYSRKIREGWSPVDPESVPDEWKSMHATSGKVTGIIVEGLILCERDKNISKRRKKAMDFETQRRTDALDHDLEQVNRTNRNPAFGDIQKASKRVPVREVPIQND